MTRICLADVPPTRAAPLKGSCRDGSRTYKIVSYANKSRATRQRCPNACWSLRARSFRPRRWLAGPTICATPRLVDSVSPLASAHGPRIWTYRCFEADRSRGEQDLNDLWPIYLRTQNARVVRVALPVPAGVFEPSRHLASRRGGYKLRSARFDDDRRSRYQRGPHW